MMFLTHAVMAIALFSSFSITPTNGACKQISFAGAVTLPPDKCFGAGTSSILITCTPSNYTAAAYGTGDCTGAAGSFTLPLGSTDVCGANDTSCFVTMSSYSAGACVASELQFSASLVPDTCFGGFKAFCSGNMTNLAFYSAAGCTGSVGGLVSMENNRCLRSQGSATQMGTCSGGAAAPAGPSTAAGSAYVQAAMSSSTSCTGSVGSAVFVADGSCVTGTKYYCENSGAQTVAVSYSNGTFCTGSVVSVTRQDTGVCSNAGTGLYQQQTCSAGSSGATSSATVSATSSLVVDYYLDNTCATKSGSGTFATGVCANGDMEYTCSSGTSATFSTYDSGSGACNASQVVPPIVNVVLGSGVCANLRGEYVKVVSCGSTSAAGRITGVFAVVFSVAVGYLSQL